MSNSPITQRVQKALYMKSAMKQADIDGDEENPIKEEDNITAEDPRTGTIKTGRMVDEIIPGESTSTSEGLEGSYKGNDLYKGDYYASDSPLGREMSKLGITDLSKDSIKKYEKSKLIENKQRRLSGNIKDDGAFGDVTATDGDGNSRTLSNEETLALTPEQIAEQNQTTTTQGEDKVVSTFVGKNKPQEFAVMNQLDAGKNARGNRKKINTTMRQEQKLGAFSGKNPETGKRWTKKEKRLYAASLTSGKDMGYGTGVGIGGQSYEGNKMVYQKRTGGNESNTFTNINNPTENTNTQINPTTGNLEQKPSDINMKEDKYTPARMMGVTPLKNKFKSLVKAIDKGKDAAKVSKKTKTIDVGYSVDGKKFDSAGKEITSSTSTSVVKSGPSSSPSPNSTGNLTFDPRSTKTASKSGGETLKGTKSFAEKAGGTLGRGYKKIKPVIKYGAAGALGAGTYAFFNSGSDPKVTPPEGGGGGNGGGGSNNNNTSNDNKVVKPKPKKMPGTPGVSVIDGVRRDIPVGKDYSTPTVSNSLSSTLAAQNEADKMTRAKGKQDRKDMKLASRQKRRANRRANPTLVGGALRKTFGGKMFNSSINNMGSQRRGPGYENKA